MEKARILVICTGNSCRSQMAEGLIRSRMGDKVEVSSAGVSPAGRVHPYAIEILKEARIDISRHDPKHVDQFSNEEFDLVITVCGNARDTCPVFPGAPEHVHWKLNDPGNTIGCAAEIKESFRDTVTQIMRKMSSLEKKVDQIIQSKQ